MKELNFISIICDVLNNAVDLIILRKHGEYVSIYGLLGLISNLCHHNETMIHMMTSNNCLNSIIKLFHYISETPLQQTYFNNTNGIFIIMYEISFLVIFKVDKDEWINERMEIIQMLIVAMINIMELISLSLAMDKQLKIDFKELIIKLIQIFKLIKNKISMKLLRSFISILVILLVNYDYVLLDTLSYCFNDVIHLFLDDVRELKDIFGSNDQINHINYVKIENILNTLIKQ